MCRDIHILSLIVLVSNIVFRMIRKGNMFFELLMIGSWKVDVPLMKLLNLADFETLLCTLRSCNRKVKQNHVVVIRRVSLLPSTFVGVCMYMFLWLHAKAQRVLVL